MKRQIPLLFWRRRKHTMSMIYRPVNVHPKGVPGPSTESQKLSTPLSKSFRLMVDNGLIRQSSCFGAYHFLPMGLRSLEKLIRIVDHFMDKANCQKIQMPTLTSDKLWAKTGRLEECAPELLTVSDRHSKRYLLSPTHEEAICDLISNANPLSHRQLPLRLYQITDKFRDEKRPRFGLMRARQFLMKDLYTFDADEDKSSETYEEIVKVYGELFDALGLKWVKAFGSTGTIGGKRSDEFHLLSEVGEDNIVHCQSCSAVFNGELLEEEAEEKISRSATGSGHSAPTSSNNLSCIKCGSSDLSNSKSIEVGHAFLLGTKYSKPFKTCYVNENNSQVLMEMGCYGIGISRLLASIIEVSSTEKEIRLPPAVAPYFLSVLPPKAGSKEEKSGNHLLKNFYQVMQEMLGNDLIVDDRLDQTVGKRLLEAKKLGIPYIAVFGKSLLNELHPFIELQDVNSGQVHSLSDRDIVKFLYDAKTKATIK